LRHSTVWLQDRPVIETRRLTLRPFEPGDADFLFELFRRPEVARWSGDGTAMTDREQAVTRIAGQPERIGDHPAAGIFLVSSHGGAPLGMAILVPIPSSVTYDRHDMEIGWHFHPDAWGHGYATEAAAALVERAFAADIPELYAVTDLDNGPSQGVCRRLGMIDLGVRRDWYDLELRAFRLVPVRDGVASAHEL
jgi:RimJ/RimL family protein N-acetyltransferase